MDLTKNENDKLPDETIETRAHTYQGMMTLGYTVFLPVVLAIVMFITLLMLDVGVVTNIFLSFLTWLGVLGIAKTFFVH